MFPRGSFLYKYLFCPELYVLINVLLCLLKMDFDKISDLCFFLYSMTFWKCLFKKKVAVVIITGLVINIQWEIPPVK